MLPSVQLHRGVLSVQEYNLPCMLGLRFNSVSRWTRLYSGVGTGPPVRLFSRVSSQFPRARRVHTGLLCEKQDGRSCVYWIAVFGQCNQL